VSAVDDRLAPLWWVLGAIALAALLVLPIARGNDDNTASGFDGYVQSGTCATPSGELRVSLEGADDAHDIEPYVAVGHDGQPVTLGFYGAPGLPGLSVATIYSELRLSMVVTDERGAAVACGDLLEPADSRFGESGVAVAQLLPAGSSRVQGLVSIERTTLQRELDITPTRARIVLTTDPVTVPADPVAGYEGYVQSGTCEAPAGDLRAAFESEDDDYDVTPFPAISSTTGASVTVAYQGTPGVPGFSVADAYADQDFSVLLVQPGSNAPVACGNILEPVDDAFTEAGLALVQLRPTGGDGVRGYAVLDRLALQRELDITPTMARILLFAPPISGS